MTPTELWLYWSSTNDEVPPLSIAATVAHHITNRLSDNYVGIDDRGYFHRIPASGRYTIYVHGTLRPITTCMLLAFARRCRYSADGADRDWADKVFAQHAIKRWKRTWQ